MSGAEAAGLAVGVIALASLFTTCIDLLDYFELGKNYLYDYELACTKVNILHKRLSHWGYATRIQDPSYEHPSFSHPARRDAVGNSLLKLSAILANTEGLRKKYDLRPTSQAAEILPKQQSRSNRLAHWSLQLRRRTTWSIRDRAKFDRFIDDISFLIDNLEKVSESDNFNQMAPQLPLKQAQATGLGTGQAEISINRARVSHQSQQDRTTNSQTSANNTGRESEPQSMGNPSDAADHLGDGERTFSATTEQIRANGVPTVDLKGLEQVNNSTLFAHLGIVDAEKGVYQMSGSKQINSGNTSGFMGAASVTSLLKLQQAAYEYHRSAGK